jgi:hypothetical protein
MAANAHRFIPFSRDWRDVATTGAAAALLALFWWLAVSASFSTSHTSDELPHITAGYVFDRFGDFRMHPENGILPQRLFGLVPLAMDARFPMDDLLWRRSVTWQLGWDFFYGLSNPLDWIVLGARSLNALFGVGLGLFIFIVARSWWGRWGGVLALASFTFSPQFLAHAGFATSDLAAATLLTLAPWFFWRHLERRSLGSGLLAGLCSGLALVAKFNGLLLAPIYAVLVLADAALRRPGGDQRARMRRLASNGALALAQAGAAVLVIWAFHNFRYGARGPGMPAFEQFAGSWDEMMPALGWKRGFVALALRWRVLPESWLYGLTNTLHGTVARHSFFAGEHSMQGWWQFFPTLVLLKTPVGTLAALVVAIAAAALIFVRSGRERRQSWAGRLAPLGVSAGVVGLAGITSNINIGDRHILPVFPLFFVLVGLLGRLPRGRWLALGLAGVTAAETLAFRPHYLASFNALAGGPARAYRLFVDSSLDWGQDLPALHAWLEGQRRPGEGVYLGYFGSAWPPHYGVRPSYFLPATTYLVRPPLQPYALEPGLYCISATILAETYSAQRGPWTIDHEKRYRELQARFRSPTVPPAVAGSDVADYAEYDRLRFSRLCKYLQWREPLGNAGYSILIFRLTRAQIDAALEGRVSSLHRLRSHP